SHRTADSHSLALTPGSGSAAARASYKRSRPGSNRDRAASGVADGRLRFADLFSEVGGASAQSRDRPASVLAWRMIIAALFLVGRRCQPHVGSSSRPAVQEA